MVNKETLAERVHCFADSKVLIIGDIMIDEYLMGSADRISPEAPVPVVHVSSDRHVLGGAGNVAKNVRTLGGVPKIITVSGTGMGADLLNALLDSEGIEHDIQQIGTRKTTRKTRILASNQQMIRIDREDTATIQGETLDQLMARVENCISEYEVVIVSDYGKGVVSKEFMERLSFLSDAQENRPKIFVDPKTPNFRLYQNVFILTPNAKETSEGANLPVGTREEILEAGREIFRLLDCDKLLTTLGPLGMALFDDEDTVWHVPTMAQEVFDVTGAGDTVIATAALAVASGCSLIDSCVLANYAAGVVVGHVGAASVTPDQLIETIQSLPLPPVEKWT